MFLLFLLQKNMFQKLNVFKQNQRQEETMSNGSYFFHEWNGQKLNYHCFLEWLKTINIK